MEFHKIEMQGRLVLEMSSLPSWQASDEGRLIYDTTNDTLYVGGSADWIEMADDADLQTHIGLTGTSVHGLGTMSTQNASNVNITGGSIKLTNGTTINEFSIDGTLLGDSDDAVPTEKAVKAYVDAYSQGLDWQESVLSRCPVGSASTSAAGTRYIATATGGGWTVDYVYEWNGSSWDENVPTEGFATWVEDEDVVFTYNSDSDWVKFGTTVTHANLMGLTGSDDHTQYMRLLGRSGGQILHGGTDASDDLHLKSTDNATRGNIHIGENSTYDDVNHRLGINELSPSTTLDVNGYMQLQTGTSINNISTGTGLGSSDDIICTQLAIKTYIDGRTTGSVEDSHYHDQRYFTETESDARFLLEANNLSDLVSQSSARSNLGLGTIAVQNTINNDDWSGTDLAIVNGGTGASSTTTARSNLGLTGDVSTHHHDAMYFTETESDARFLLEANNLSDLTDPSAARTNLGLTGEAGYHTHDNRYFTETESDARFLLEANNLSDLDNFITARSNLGLGSIALLSSINDGNWSGTDLAVANGGTGGSDAATARTNLGLTGSSNTTHYHDGMYFTETESDARFLLEANNLSDLVSQPTARSNLGLGSLAVLSNIDNSNWSGTDLAITNGGTGASDALNARSNLGLGDMAVQDTINDNDWLGADLAVTNGGTGGSDAATARSNLGLTGTSNTTHYHDTRYYTESEIDTQMSNKYDAGDLIKVSDGTVTAPGLTFNSDTDNGLYRIGSDNWGFTAAATRIMDINSSGLLLSSGARVNEFSTDGTMTGNSNAATPTEQAVKTYVDSVATGGGGGGTNADMVDGLHATSFIRSDASDTVTGSTRWNDGHRVEIGSGSNMDIYHSGGVNYIDMDTTEVLHIRGASGEEMAVFTPNAGVSLYYNNSSKFVTSNTGATITGTLAADGVIVGDDEIISCGASTDLQIYHQNSTNDNRINSTRDLIISNGAEIMARFQINGPTQFYYDDSIKIQTQSTGVKVTGVVEVTNGGTAALPAYSFDGDENTGMYRIGADTIGFTANSTRRFSVDGYGVSVDANGSAANPSLRLNDANTGLYQVAANAIGFSCAGSRIADIGTSGLYLTSGTRVNEFSTDGTMTGNSDNAVPTEQAVKTYVDNHLSGDVSSHHHNGMYFTETESDARFLLEANNLSDLVSPSTARSNLGLGSLATATTINNTDWSGTDLAIVNGGTGASTAATARSNLGLTGTSNTTHYHDSRYFTESESNSNFLGISANAVSATKLVTARTINGVSFDGTGNITVEPYISDDDTGDTNCPIVFSANSTAGYKRLYEDSTLYFDNTNNRLYSTYFYGALVGNASTATTATNFSGSLAGDVTGTQGATVVGNNSHTHTGSTISALDGADITTGTVLDARLPATISSNITGSSASCTGNAATATKLATARTIDITGDITAAAVAFDGTANIAISATVNNDSHTHNTQYYTESEIDGMLSHTIASHSDTSATGTQLNTLVGGGATTLHSHSGGGVQVKIEEGDTKIECYDPGVYIDHHVNGTAMARMTTTGLYIGTNNAPSYRLDIHGNAALRVRDGSSNEALSVTNSGVTINDTGVDRDFRVESNVDASNFCINGADGNIGIGTVSPDRKLHVYTGNSSTTGDSDTQLVVEDDGHAGISILSGSSSEGQIYFGDSGSATAGRYWFDHSDNEHKWDVGGVTVQTLGNSSPTTFTVQGAADWVYMNLDNYSDGVAPAMFSFRRSRNDTMGTITTTENGDVLGMMNWSGAYGSAFMSSASIIVAQAGTATASGIPSEMVLQTSDSSGSQDNMTLTSDGKVNLVNGTGVNEFSTDGTLAGNSNDAIPTEYAVKTYVDGVVHTESHTIASHSDTTATGTQLNTLVGGGATTLHSHTYTYDKISEGDSSVEVTDPGASSPTISFTLNGTEHANFISTGSGGTRASCQLPSGDYTYNKAGIGMIGTPAATGFRVYGGVDWRWFHNTHSVSSSIFRLMESGVDFVCHDTYRHGVSFTGSESQWKLAATAGTGNGMAIYPDNDTYGTSIEIGGTAGSGRADAVTIHGYTFGTIIRPDASRSYHFNTVRLGTSNHKYHDIGANGAAFDDVYADDFHNVADYYFLDDRDDLAALHEIQGSGIINEATGLEIIDDNTVPEWMLSKHSKDKKETPNTWDEDTMEVSSYTPSAAKGDTMYDEDGAPYISMKLLTSLLIGATKQLDNRVREEKIAADVKIVELESTIADMQAILETLTG